MKSLGITVLLAIGLLGGSSALARDLMAMSPADFSAQPELNRPLAVDSLDRELLAAAIFHETNRVRLSEHLPVLRSLAKLNAAADIQSHVGVVSRPLSHTNPFPQISDPLDRVKYVGLMPGYVSENIALVSIYDAGTSPEFGITRVRGQDTFIDLKTGLELKVHTYRSYAMRVVGDWLGSPGHRKNLLDPTVQYLGCSVYPSTGNFGEGIIFSVQVFYTPK